MARSCQAELIAAAERQTSYERVAQAESSQVRPSCTPVCGGVGLRGARTGALLLLALGVAAMLVSRTARLRASAPGLRGDAQGAEVQRWGQQEVAVAIPVEDGPRDDRGGSRHGRAICNSSAPVQEGVNAARAFDLPEGVREACTKLPLPSHVPHWEGQNVCWEWMKQVGCYDVHGVLSWQEAQARTARKRFAPVSASGAMRALGSPGLCDRRGLGALSTVTGEEVEAARVWLQATVAVFVLSASEDSSGWRAMSTRLGELGVAFRRLRPVDLTLLGAMDKARWESLWPRTYNMTRAQENADSQLQSMGGIVGAVGCAAGYLRILKEAAARATGHRPLALVLEEDAVPAEDFAVRLRRLMVAEAPCDWSVISLESQCPYGDCVSPHLTRVRPDGNEPAERCRQGVNSGLRAMLYRQADVASLVQRLEQAVWDMDKPHCLDVDAALAATSDEVAYYAVPSVQRPSFLRERPVESSPGPAKCRGPHLSDLAALVRRGPGRGHAMAARSAPSTMASTAATDVARAEDSADIADSVGIADSAGTEAAASSSAAGSAGAAVSASAAAWTAPAASASATSTAASAEGRGGDVFRTWANLPTETSTTATTTATTSTKTASLSTILTSTVTTATATTATTLTTSATASQPRTAATAAASKAPAAPTTAATLPPGMVAPPTPVPSAGGAPTGASGPAPAGGAAGPSVPAASGPPTAPPPRTPPTGAEGSSAASKADVLDRIHAYLNWLHQGPGGTGARRQHKTPAATTTPGVMTRIRAFVSASGRRRPASPAAEAPPPAAAQPQGLAPPGPAAPPVAAPAPPSTSAESRAPASPTAAPTTQALLFEAVGAPWTSAPPTTALPPAPAPPTTSAVPPPAAAQPDTTPPTVAPPTPASPPAPALPTNFPLPPAPAQPGTAPSTVAPPTTASPPVPVPPTNSPSPPPAAAQPDAAPSTAPPTSTASPPAPAPPTNLPPPPPLPPPPTAARTRTPPSPAAAPARAVPLPTPPPAPRIMLSGTPGLEATTPAWDEIGKYSFR
uniref:Uncharacterized protein n=1 Tax=Alexandrium monilatum TaxID=311494 RepID=A0A7S4QYP2_9DINO